MRGLSCRNGAPSGYLHDPEWDLRRAHDMTQAHLAKQLGKSQVTIAQMEKRTDLLLSTLRHYIEALGGRLDLVVQFPDQAPIVLKQLSGEIESASDK